MRGWDKSRSLGESYGTNVLPQKDWGGSCRTKLEEFRRSGDELVFLPFSSIEGKVEKLQELFYHLRKLLLHEGRHSE